MFGVLRCNVWIFEAAQPVRCLFQILSFDACLFGDLWYKWMPILGYVI